MKTSRFFCLFLALTLLAAGCRKKPTAITTPLHQAARAGNIEQVQSLISNGADVNVKDEDGGTPLHEAAFKGHKEVTELLISNRADVNAKNKDGWTPLFLALPTGNIDLVALLTVNGADVNVKCGRDMETPLHYAAREGYKEITELLIAKGANLNARQRIAKHHCTMPSKEVARMLLNCLLPKVLM